MSNMVLRDFSEIPMKVYIEAMIGMKAYEEKNKTAKKNYIQNERERQLPGPLGKFRRAIRLENNKLAKWRERGKKAGPETQRKSLAEVLASLSLKDIYTSDKQHDAKETKNVGPAALDVDRPSTSKEDHVHRVSPKSRSPTSMDTGEYSTPSAHVDEPDPDGYRHGGYCTPPAQIDEALKRRGEHLYVSNMSLY